LQHNLLDIAVIPPTLKRSARSVWPFRRFVCHSCAAC